MASRKTPPKNLRDRITAKVAATVLWPVAKARPESDWARMQKRLSHMSDGETRREGDEGGSENPFIRAVEEAAKVPEQGGAKSAGPDEVKSEGGEGGAKVDAPKANSGALSASEDLGAWPPGPGPNAGAPGAAPREALGAAVPPGAASAVDPSGDEKSGEPGVSRDDEDDSAQQEETEFATWAREHGGSRELPAVRKVQSVLFQRGVRPPMALFALLLSVAAAAWLYDYWRKPREPQPAGVSSSSVVRGSGAER